MAIEPGTIVVAGIMAASNFGAIVFTIKRYTGYVDDHNKILPAVMESLKTNSSALERTVKSLDDLYESRNDHEVRLTEVETIHKLNGCDQPKKERA